MADSPNLPSLDFFALERHYATQETSASRLIAALLPRLEAFADPAVWIYRTPPDELLAQARRVEERRQAGEVLPLYGLPFGVKDSIDVAGQPTTAACPGYAYTPKKSNAVVASLLEAGALCVGKTNLDQLGCGLAGDRSPYGACRNPFDAEYISGGSSSGSAVAVAGGLVSFALATDTAGSTRVPAGTNNIVGFKPAPGKLSTDGVVPSCPSLDTVTVMALTVEDALAVYRVALGKVEPIQGSAGSVVFVTPRDEDLEFFGDRGQAELFRRAMERLEKSGWRRLTVDFRPFREVAALLYEGPWLAERLAAIEGFLTAAPAAIYPVTRTIIEGGSRYSGVDVFKGFQRLNALRAECLQAFAKAEVLIVPTLPTIPKLAEVQADSVGWSRRLGHYTNFANLLRLAGLALPAGFTPNGLPGGFTMLAPEGSETRLCELGMVWQKQADLPLGATGKRSSRGAVQATTAAGPVAEGQVRVAVAGAHLRGQPFHAALLKTGARFVRACRTAARYRFVAFMGLNPPRPGLLRDDDRGGAAEVEIYDLPVAGFGALTASVAPPLAIGTIVLEDGEAVKGFLCESWDAARARDITEFGGWVAFLQNRSGLAPQPGRKNA